MANNTWEIGCYGDGTFGHQHTRERCADCLQDARTHGFIPHDLVRDLSGEMSDDAHEEYAACDWLNAHAAVEGASWGWQDGDFGLWADESEET